jgi:hypothetical protein
LPIRALGFALISDPLVLLAVQALDGISATVLGVLTALIIAELPLLVAALVVVLLVVAYLRQLLP